MNRPAGLGRITSRFGNRGQRLGEGGIGIAAGAQEIRHVENDRACAGSRPRPACAAEQGCRRQERRGEIDRSPPSEGLHPKAPLAITPRQARPGYMNRSGTGGNSPRFDVAPMVGRAQHPRSLTQ
jgi:hypothetical protein